MVEVKAVKWQAPIKRVTSAYGRWGFVQAVLSAACGAFRRRYRLAAEGYDFSRLLARVAELTDVRVDQVVTPDRSRRSVRPEAFCVLGNP